MNNLVLNGPAIVRRNDISGGVDFIKAAGTWTGSAGDIVANYMHGYGYHNDDADQASSTPPSVSHNDGVQVNGGIDGLPFHGNNVEMYYEPALSVGSPDASSGTGWGCAFTMSGGGRSAAADAAGRGGADDEASPPIRCPHSLCPTPEGTAHDVRAAPAP